MQTIGERLEEARKRKGISIREASEATKIRSEYLHKLEGNSFDLNLPEIYVRGFLRNYAIYLRLNGEKLVSDYRSLVPTTEGRGSRRENRENYGRMDLAPTARPPAAEGEPTEEGSEAPAPAAPTMVRTKSFPASAGTSTPPIDPALLMKLGVGALALIVLVALVFGIRSCSGGPSKPAVELNPVSQQTLTLTATGPVDVQVREEADGPIIWRGHMEANDSHSIPKRGKLFLTASEMKNIQIDVGGKRLPNPYSGLLKVQIP